MYIERILSKNPTRLFTIRDSAPLIDAAKILSDKQNGAVIVCNDYGSMVGIISKWLE